MNQRVVDFLNTHRVGCLTILQNDGTPHGAALHYSHWVFEHTLELFFSTSKLSRKCEIFSNAEAAPASVVIGFSEDEWVTLQMDGQVAVVTDEVDLQVAKEMHYPKHPNSQKFENDPDTVFLSFKPSWWRYTDFNTKPPTIEASGQNS